MVNSMMLLELLQRGTAEGGRGTEETRIDPLVLLLAAALAPRPTPHAPRPTVHDRRRNKMRRLTLREFCRDYYLPGKGHPENGSTAELSRWALARLRECLGHDATLQEATPELFERFRTWLSQQVLAGKFAAATANKHLRQLRALVNYAARPQRRWAKPVRSLDFLKEQPAEVRAWSPEDLARIEAQARALAGDVAGVPRKIWWTAWVLVFSRIGCRVNALMSTERTDYAQGALLLRRETQKQKRDQRILLPPRASAAIEELLAAHSETLIWPWPHDPPSKQGGRRNWKCLSAHFRRLLLDPLGLELPKGIATRQFRRTAATLVDEQGGDAQALLGHASRKTTEGYKDRRRMRVCREALHFPEAGRAQLELF